MSTMLLNRKTSVDPAVHRQNVQVLLGKIAEADGNFGGRRGGYVRFLRLQLLLSKRCDI